MIRIISGTNRPNSSTRRVAGMVEALYQERKQSALVVDLQTLPLDCFSPPAYAEKPEEFSPFVYSILECTGLVIVTPEYNGSMPGVLKYFIDLLPFPAALDRKPVCFVGVADGQWGGLRAVEHLQQICLYRQAHIHPARVLIPGIGKALRKGILPAEYSERLVEQTDQFIGFVERHRRT
jgi:NAD(P)H-dependent FMN reductase